MGSTGVENGVFNETEIQRSKSQRSKNSMDGGDEVIINSSGYPDQLTRHYGLLSICGLALAVDNAWVAVGTSLAVSIYNGEAPGVIWELFIASFYYTFINASIAEVCSTPTGSDVHAD
jgi:choline transport protein